MVSISLTDLYYNNNTCPLCGKPIIFIVSKERVVDFVTFNMYDNILEIHRTCDNCNNIITLIINPENDNIIYDKYRFVNYGTLRYTLECKDNDKDD